MLKTLSAVVVILFGLTVGVQSAGAGTQPDSALAAQQTGQCADLLERGNAASTEGRAEAGLALYRQARQLGCNAPGLDGAIAGLERSIRHTRQCTDLLERGKAAGAVGLLESALGFYQQARQLGCDAPSLDTTIADLARSIQHSRKCDALIERGNAAGSARRLGDALGFYQQARQFGCAAPWLDGIIANLERSIKHTQECDDLLLRGNAAARDDRPHDALAFYDRARHLGCSAAGLDTAIASAERSLHHTQRCNDILRRGNVANDGGRRHDALRLYHEARQLGCTVQGLDATIAKLERSMRQSQRCNDLLQRANAANSAGRLQDALGLYRDARQLGCDAQELDTAVVNLERSIQDAQRCHDLLELGNAANSAGRPQDALGLYRQIHQLGCDVQGLDSAITTIEDRLRQARPETGATGEGPPGPGFRCPPGTVMTGSGLPGQGEWECRPLR
jgi:hypothetical protein